MLEVKCKICPIENFCPQLDLAKRLNQDIRGEVNNHDCPLVLLATDKLIKDTQQEPDE